jgi:hypothetical protein
MGRGSQQFAMLALKVDRNFVHKARNERTEPQ